MPEAGFAYQTFHHCSVTVPTAHVWDSVSVVALGSGLLPWQGQTMFLG